MKTFTEFSIFENKTYSLILSSKFSISLRTLAVLVLALLPVFSWAQGEFKRGYIIKLDNLFEPAYIQILDPVIAAQICRYKTDSVGQVKEYRPNEILGYKFLTGETFYAAIVEENGIATHSFLENLSDGRLKLFGLINRFFISGESLKFTELTEDTYRDVLSEYFKDCPYLVSRIKKIQFTRRALLKAVKEYDECIKSGSDSYQGRNIKVEKGILIGISNSSIEFDVQDDFPQFSGEELTNLSLVNVGFQAWLSLPHLSKRLSLRTGLFYENQKFYNVKIIEPTVYQLDLELSQLKLPLGLQFDIMETDKFTFYTSGGVSLPVNTRLESKEVRDTSLGSSVYIDESVPFSSLEDQKEAFIGLGSTVSIFPKFKLIVDITYNFGSGTFLTTEPTDTLGSRFRTTTLKIGLIF